MTSPKGSHLLLKFLLAAIFLTGSNKALQAQTNSDEASKESLFSSVPDSLIVSLADYLPPLPMLIDSAIAHSPQVAYFEARVRAGEFAVSSTKKDWAKSVNVSATFNGGTNNILQETINVVGTNYGARVTIPLSLFIGQKDRVEQARATMQSERARLEETKRMVRIEVIETYNEIFNLQRKLAITNEARQQANVIMVQSHKKFIENDMGLEDLGRNTELKAKYANLFEDQRTAFSNAYFKLQRLVGVPFSKFNLGPWA